MREIEEIVAPLSSETVLEVSHAVTELNKLSLQFTAEAFLIALLFRADANTEGMARADEDSGGLVRSTFATELSAAKELAQNIMERLA